MIKFKMGVAIKDILDYDIIKLQSLNSKSIAIDTFNMLYQFLASIRQQNGEQLKDNSGNITSHLRGLFSRLCYFKKNNIKAVFIFDGKAPDLKEATRKLRSEKKEKAKRDLEKAKEGGNEYEIAKFSKAINYLDSKMIEDSKKLIALFGFPIVNAPSEGEAQASKMCSDKLVYSASSQDFDSLLFSTPTLIRNLSISAKRKVPGTSIYKDTEIEFYNLEKNLKRLGITQQDLIVIGMLCGTDFNPKGIPRIGPKKALKIVIENTDKTYKELFEKLNWSEFFDFDWLEVFEIFDKPNVIKVEKIIFSQIKKEEIKIFLKKFDFDEFSIQRSLDNVKIIKSLNEFF
jgi:flap endonuclease-1